MAAEEQHLANGSISPASRALRRAFIPKVAACATWQPRLADRLLPKYVMTLDGACTAFLLM
jgi:hypothetical protein